MSESDEKFYLTLVFMSFQHNFKCIRVTSYSQLINHTSRDLEVVQGHNVCLCMHSVNINSLIVSDKLYTGFTQSVSSTHKLRIVTSVGDIHQIVSSRYNNTDRVNDLTRIG